MLMSFGGFTLAQSDRPLDQLLMVSIPALIILLFSLVSSLLAIYATTPKDFRTHDEKHPGILLLVKKDLDIDLYISQMASILKSNESIYKSMSTDMYSISNHLSYKNHLLRRAYLVFFAGIVLAVISFLVVWFTTIGV
jgi:hypothetical protein